MRRSAGFQDRRDLLKDFLLFSRHCADAEQPAGGMRDLLAILQQVVRLDLYLGACRMIEYRADQPRRLAEGGLRRLLIEPFLELRVGRPSRRRSRARAPG